ncbi:cupin domain-containing protein [Clavibacter michiganensis]|nr:cupin domain-containing protein [Clavibacter michiganensis]
MANTQPNSPTMPYLSMWTTPDGLSSIGLTELRGFVQGSVGGKASPLWMREMPGTVERVLFNFMEVGWEGEWHESPVSQWIVPLSGRWFIETQDGTRVEMGPGDIHWGQDLNTREINGDVGHRSGQLGDEPCVQMMIQFAEPHNAGSFDPFD